MRDFKICLNDFELTLFPYHIGNFCDQMSYPDLVPKEKNMKKRDMSNVSETN